MTDIGVEKIRALFVGQVEHTLEKHGDDLIRIQAQKIADINRGFHQNTVIQIESLLGTISAVQRAYLTQLKFIRRFLTYLTDTELVAVKTHITKIYTQYAALMTQLTTLVNTASSL